MEYGREIVSLYENRLRNAGLLADEERIVGINDNSQDYRKGGQIIWWELVAELQDGTRTYVLKAPYDTFGDGTTSFVRERAERSRILREAGVNVPLIGVYDKGTFIHEYVPGRELASALKGATPEQKESFLRQKAEIIRRCEELGLTLMDDHNGNFIVNDGGEVILLDLDFIQKR